MKKIPRLGTRGSPLALIQARNMRDLLLKAHGNAFEDIEIVPIRTSGDWRPEQKERMFLETGGDKGLFTKEIEEALRSGFVDLAVHSMKDVPGQLPDDLDIAAVPERADPRDAFVSKHAGTLDDLPSGATVGTASLRRQAQILARRPDLRVTALRGNVDTRLRKLENGDADATILALAGLRRLGADTRVTSILDTEVMLPAAGQGAIAVEIRRNDDDMRRLLIAVNHPPSAVCIAAERAFLRAVGGSCQTPIGALAVLDGKNSLKLDVLAAKPDGTAVIRMNRSGPQDSAATIGREIGEELKRRLPPDFFARAA